MAVLKIREAMRIYRQGTSNKDGNVFLFWDRSTILAPGSHIEVSEPVRLCRRLALPFSLEDEVLVFLIFDEMSRENKRDIRKLFPEHLPSLWIN